MYDTLDSFKKEFRKYHCVYCKNTNKQGRLGKIEMYSHANGVRVVLKEKKYPSNFYGFAPKMWMYSHCKSCGYQWSLPKLRRLFKGGN